MTGDSSTTRRIRVQAGFSLLETIVTVAIAGTAVLAIVAALLTVLYSSESHERSVRAAIEATDVAEQVELIAYRKCGTTTQYRNDVAALTAPGYSFSLERVEYLTSSTSSTAGFSTGGCVNLADDKGVQRLMIRVSTGGDRPVSESIMFVKRDQTCDPQANVPVGKLC